MSQANHAAEMLKSFAKKLEPMFEAVKALEQIGSIEQAEKEAVSKKEMAVKECAQIEMKKVNAQDELNRVRGSVEAAKEEVKEIEAKAHERAKQIVEMAKTEAQHIIAQSVKMRNEASQDVSDAKRELAKVMGEVSMHSASCDAIKKEYSEIKNKLSSFMKG